MSSRREGKKPKKKQRRVVGESSAARWRSRGVEDLRGAPSAAMCWLNTFGMNCKNRETHTHARARVQPGRPR